MQHAASQHFEPQAVTSLGQVAMLRQVHTPADLGPLAALLISRAGADTGAQPDLSTLLLAKGGLRAEEGRVMQRDAVRAQQSFEVVHGAGTGPDRAAAARPGQRDVGRCAGHAVPAAVGQATPEPLWCIGIKRKLGCEANE